MLFARYEIGFYQGRGKPQKVEGKRIPNTGFPDSLLVSIRLRAAYSPRWYRSWHLLRASALSMGLTSKKTIIAKTKVIPGIRSLRQGMAILTPPVQCIYFLGFREKTFFSQAV
jgi:hypothetical protein